ARAREADGLADDRAVLQEEPPHERRALPGVRRAGRLRAAAQRQMPVYGDEDVLLQLPGALLQAADARADPRGHAVFRAADALSPPRRRRAAHDRNQKREEAIGGTA